MDCFAFGASRRRTPQPPRRPWVRRAVDCAVPWRAGRRGLACPLSPRPPPARRTRARRRRSPTVVPVRAATQTPVISPGLVREVQPPLIGLPDPTRPLPLPRRRVREEDPYAQVGYRVGNLSLYPSQGNRAQEWVTKP